jgi:uncharacterized ParB-like nuclease family protein
MSTNAKMIDVTKITVDHRYQRPLDEKRVSKIAESFDPNLFGVLSVSKRDDGTYAAFEGQHRLAAARLVGKNKVMCLVHDNLTAQNEAELFVGLHINRKNPTPVSRFKARVFYGDKVAVNIQDIVTRSGFTIGEQAGAGTITAIVAVEKAWRLYGDEALERTLKTIADLWYEEPYAATSALILGMARFLGQYGDRLDTMHLEKLRSTTPMRVLDAARAKGTTSLAVRVAGELRKRTGVVGKPSLRAVA